MPKGLTGAYEVGEYILGNFDKILRVTGNRGFALNNGLENGRMGDLALGNMFLTKANCLAFQLGSTILPW